MMMRKTKCWALVWTLCLPLFSGCTWPIMTEENGYRPAAMGKQDQVMYWDNPRPLHLSESFGESVRAINAAQTLDPDAPHNLDPIEGQEGIAGINAANRYRNLFKKPPFKAGKGGASKK